MKQEFILNPVYTFERLKLDSVKRGVLQLCVNSGVKTSCFSHEALISCKPTR